MTLNMDSKTQDSIQQGQAFIKQVRTKMDRLVEEFATGKVNREQFQVLYDRYQTQINGVKALIDDADPSKWTGLLQGGENTIDIRSRLMAKAKGMLIYHNENGTLIDKLGMVLIDPLLISQLMEKLSQQVEKNKAHTTIVVEDPVEGWIFLSTRQCYDDCDDVFS